MSSFRSGSKALPESDGGYTRDWIRDKPIQTTFTTTTCLRKKILKGLRRRPGRPPVADLRDACSVEAETRWQKIESVRSTLHEPW